MKSWIERADADIELDPDRFVDWLLDEGFVAHVSRRDEYTSDTCPECGTGHKAWQFMVRSDGWANCYSCGYGTRNGFRVVADWEGIDLGAAARIVGSAGILDEDIVWKKSAGAPLSDVPPSGPCQSASITLPGVSWFDPAIPLPQPWMSMALAAVMRRGYTAEFLHAKRIGFGTMGRTTDRVVLPVFVGGEFAYYTAWDWTREQTIKYQTPRRADTVVQRSDIVFQGDLYLETEGPLVVAEGQYNAWAAESVGYPAVATFGKGVTEQQKSLLLKSKSSELILAFDQDARFVAGPLASEFMRRGKTTRIVDYPDGRDLDDHEPAVVQGLLANAKPPHWLDDAPTLDGSKPRPPKPVRIATPPSRAKTPAGNRFSD